MLVVGRRVDDGTQIDWRAPRAESELMFCGHVCRQAFRSAGADRAVVRTARVTQRRERHESRELLDRLHKPLRSIVAFLRNSVDRDPRRRHERAIHGRE